VSVGLKPSLVLCGIGRKCWVNSVQGLDDLWRKEVEQVDGRVKESLRTKAQMSDQDIDKCFQPFTQQLLQSQSRQLAL